MDTIVYYGTLVKNEIFTVQSRTYDYVEKYPFLTPLMLLLIMFISLYISGVLNGISQLLTNHRYYTNEAKKIERKARRLFLLQNDNSSSSSSSSTYNRNDDEEGSTNDSDNDDDIDDESNIDNDEDLTEKQKIKLKKLRAEKLKKIEIQKKRTCLTRIRTQWTNTVNVFSSPAGKLLFEEMQEIRLSTVLWAYGFNIADMVVNILAITPTIRITTLVNEQLINALQLTMEAYNQQQQQQQQNITMNTSNNSATGYSNHDHSNISSINYPNNLTTVMEVSTEGDVQLLSPVLVSSIETNISSFPPSATSVPGPFLNHTVDTVLSIGNTTKSTNIAVDISLLMQQLWILIGWMLFYAIVGRIFNSASSQLFAQAKGDRVLTRRRRFFRNLLLQDKVFHQNREGKLGLNTIDIADSVDRVLLTNIPRLFNAILQFLVGLVGCFWIDYQVTIVAILVQLPYFSGLSDIMYNATRVYDVVEEERNTELSLVVTEAFTHIDLVQMSAAEELVVQNAHRLAVKRQTVLQVSSWPQTLTYLVYDIMWRTLSRLELSFTAYRALTRTPPFTMADWALFQKYQTKSDMVMMDLSNILQELRTNMKKIDQFIKIRNRKPLIDVRIKDELRSNKKPLLDGTTGNQPLTSSFLSSLTSTATGTTGMEEVEDTTEEQLLNRTFTTSLYDAYHKYPVLDRPTDLHHHSLHPSNGNSSPTVGTLVPLPNATYEASDIIRQRPPLYCVINVDGKNYRRIPRGHLVFSNVEFSYPSIDEDDDEDKTKNKDDDEEEGEDEEKEKTTGNTDTSSSNNSNVTTTNALVSQDNKNTSSSTDTPTTTGTASENEKDVPKDMRILKGLTFTVPSGALVAFVGASGSGKTTIFRLLTRMFDVDNGSITIDGYDLRQYAPRTLRRSIGYVPQNPSLLTATIRENILFGFDKENTVTYPTDDQLIAASKMANIHDDIMKMGKGYDTKVNESRLSGGQKQRLAIARAIVRNPTILLLDEATSALDPPSEGAVTAALQAAMRGRTTFVIAHRLSTVVNADIILMLENGRIVEYGTHKELLQLGQKYKDFVAAQLLDAEGNVGTDVLNSNSSKNNPEG